MHKNLVIIVAALVFIGIFTYVGISYYKSTNHKNVQQAPKNPSEECTCALKEVETFLKNYYDAIGLSSPFTLTQKCEPLLCSSVPCKGKLIVATPFGSIQSHLSISLLLMQNPTVTFLGPDPANPNTYEFEAACSDGINKPLT
jgi:hypothetical protein